MCLIPCFYLFFTTYAIQAQTDDLKDKLITVPKDSKETVYRIAGDYSAKHDALAIAISRGTAYREQYDKYLVLLASKLDSIKVPFKLFIEDNGDNKPGTVFTYFIENDLNGPFDANALYALIPHIKRRYQQQYFK